jgi:UDP-N-acetylglucosamine--N-acetylmuramyl-(pentapeptide) pyrophosphoryl-undecaprenol N-acetylglucosamine transferase
MKFIIAAGGSGGHIIPGIAIGNMLKEEGHEVLFVGTKQGMESDLIPKAGFRLLFINASGLNRGLLSKLKAIMDLNHGVTDCLKILKEEKPDMCIGTGGYVTAPLMAAGNKLKIPTLIHESNALPGKTTRLFAYKINEVCVGFSKTKEKLPSGNIVVTGNPNKMCNSTLSKEEAKLKNNINGKLLLVFGGSQGAKRINEVMCEIIHNDMFGDYDVIYATGPKNYDEVSKTIISNIGSEYNLKTQNEDEIVIERAGNSIGSLTFATSVESGKTDIKTVESLNSKSIIVKKFIYNMEEIMKASDLVVCRSGALTCTEISEVGVSSILIPFPYAAENHQFYNAKTLEEVGAAKIIEEKDLTSDLLIKSINEIMNDDNKIETMAQNSKKLKTGNPTENIKHEINKLLGVS